MENFNASCGMFHIGLSRCAFFASIFALTAASAYGQCALWNTWSPNWSFTQAENTKVYLQIERGHGSAISGSASYRDTYTLRNVTGTFEGIAQVNDFTLQISWINGQVGVYTGKISNTGQIEGTTYATSNPGRKVKWVSNTALGCATRTDAPVYELGTATKQKFTWPSIQAANGEMVLVEVCTAGASNCPEDSGVAFCKSRGFTTYAYADTASNVGRTARISNGRICSGPACVGYETLFCTTSPVKSVPARPQKTIKTTGKPRIPATAPPAANPTPVAAVAAAPMIKALPSNSMSLRQSHGKTTLSWDGGKDHPYAEVWVKIDDQDETFVIEQGKGTRVVIAEPGKTYLYILTDAGKRLATVTLKY